MTPFSFLKHNWHNLFIVLILVMLDLPNLNAQEAKEETLANGIGKGRIRDNQGISQKFTNLSYEPLTDQVSFTDPASGVKLIRSMADVLQVDRQTGSHALTYCLVGAGAGLIGSLLGSDQVKADPFIESDPELERNLTIGLTVGFGLVGALIGSGYKKYETVVDRLSENHTSSVSYVVRPASTREFFAFVYRF